MPRSFIIYDTTVTGANCKSWHSASCHFYTAQMLCNQSHFCWRTPVPTDAGHHHPLPLLSLPISQRQGPYLVPGICPIRWVDEDGDDLGLGDEGSSSLRSFLRVEIAGTFLKEEVSGDVGRSGKEIHVPEGWRNLELAAWQMGHILVFPISWRVKRWIFRHNS